MPTPSVLGELRGETTNYAGGTVDLLPVFFTCSSTKNVATEGCRQAQERNLFPMLQPCATGPPGLETGGGPSAPRGHNSPGVLLDSVASQREVEEQANLKVRYERTA